MPTGSGPARAPGGAVTPPPFSEDQAVALIDRLEENRIVWHFRLGGLLAKIRDKRWFGGFDTFDQLVERRFGLEKPTAYAAITLFETLNRHAVRWDEVRAIEADTLVELCVMASAKGMTAEEFRGCLDRARRSSGRAGRRGGIIPDGLENRRA